MAEIITEIKRTLTLNEGECGIIKMLGDEESFLTSKYKFTSYDTDTSDDEEGLDNLITVQDNQFNLILGTFYESQAQAGKNIILNIS